MADILNQLYPVRPEFVDGQNPSAAFLNAWSGLIDNAFSIIGSVLGAFDGSADGHVPYITSMTRAIGSMGEINTRLPRNLKRDSGDNPWIVEKLLPYVGEKQALLSFMPDAIQATESTKITHSDGSLTAVAAGAETPTQNLDTTGKWSLKNRMLFMSSAIDSGDTVSYEIDTGDEDRWKESFSQSAGPNVVPGIVEIATGVSTLCTISSVNGTDVFRLDFPAIRRIMKPEYPKTTTLADIIQLDDPSSPVQWAGDVPRWQVPDNIWSAAGGSSSSIPSGLVGLWVENGGSITRVYSSDVGSDITWTTGTDKHEIIFTVPPDLVGNMPHQSTPSLVDNYIVAFAGTSITEAINDTRGLYLQHSHDTVSGEGLVSAKYLENRFDPDNYYHGQDVEDLFPQYMSRKGYDSSDVLNRQNAMLGDLLMAQENAVPGSPATGAESLTGESHSIRFADALSGPLIRYSGVSDDELQAAGGTDISGRGKVFFGNKPVRVEHGVHFGNDVDNKLMALKPDTFSGYDAVKLYAGSSSAANFYHDGSLRNFETDVVTTQYTFATEEMRTDAVRLINTYTRRKFLSIADANIYHSTVDYGTGIIQEMGPALATYDNFNGSIFSSPIEVLLPADARQSLPLGSHRSLTFSWTFDASALPSEAQIGSPRSNLKVYLRHFGFDITGAGATVRQVAFEMTSMQMFEGTGPTDVTGLKQDISTYDVIFRDVIDGDNSAVAMYEQGSVQVNEVDSRYVYTVNVSVEYSPAVNYTIGWRSQGIALEYDQGVI